MKKGENTGTYCDKRMGKKSHLLLNTSRMAALQDNTQTNLPQADPENFSFYTGRDHW